MDGIDVYFMKGIGPLGQTAQEKIVKLLKPDGFLIASTNLGLPHRLLNLVLSEHGLKLIDEGNFTILQKEQRTHDQYPKQLQGQRAPKELGVKGDKELGGSIGDLAEGQQASTALQPLGQEIERD